MKISRKVQLWLADRYETFDHPGVYRRVQAAPVRTQASVWDTALLWMVGTLLFVVGVGVLLVGLFLLAVMVMVIFGK